MSRTIDLVKAFVPKRPVSEVETLEVARYGLVDSESEVFRLPDVIVPADYCCRVDTERATFWINQNQDQQLLDALEIGEKNPGAIIGTLAKVSIDGQVLHYGPIDLHNTVWEQIQLEKLDAT